VAPSKQAPPAVRPTISRDFLERERRRRFVAVAAEIAHEAGLGGVTASLICRRARSAKNTFYELFDSAADCLRYGVNETEQMLFAPVREQAGGGEWLEEVEAAIIGLYEAAAAEPVLAELLLVHSFGVELGAEDRGYDAGVAELSALLERGRAAAAERGLAEPNPLAEEYLARVVVSLAGLKVRQGEAASLLGEVHEMTTLVVTGYLGAEAASLVGRGDRDNF
jgi:AcrR family transcriptional regulator